jgi:predicted DNA-binding transcriptional regulator YafY
MIPAGLARSERRLEETKRIARILQMVELIARQPRRHLRRDLAARFEISERMLQKDLEVIRHGLRLALERTPAGYYFDAMPRLPSTQFNFQEALALLLATRAARQATGIDTADLAAAITRLESLFPEEFRPMLQKLIGAPARTAQSGHRHRMLALLHHALMDGRKVRVLYETRSRGGEVNERVVRPYHIMPYVRSWHLIAYCEWRQAPLMFKIDRIHEATILDDHYRIPKDFDVDGYLGMTWGIMRDPSKTPENVVLRFAPDAGRWVGEEYWHKSQQLEELEDGRILFKLHVVITPELVSWLLYYGSKVEVLEPPSLRGRVADEHRKAADMGKAE